ncbi:TonB-dependent receptor [Mucilaginibacter sp. HMF5004]|nr:TonB-dependent receptor [Mucilaginibacter rivuli]MBW4891050.1 TonB-dependent receptor [Mucilaginibacter rivuli]
MQSLVFGQTTGKISGKISDKKTGEALIGATVLVQENNKGAATNVNGEYNLSLPAGTYTLLVKYVGYQNKQISGIQVSAAKTTTLDVILEDASSKSLKEVVIKSTFGQESVNSLYAQQKNNAAVSDGITSETIKRSPDKSASEVLRRVSGATIQDNKFVVVRGLSDRYNNAMLDGTSLPSTEPNRKAFSFDIVPANLIDNIIINKTATPNLPGDFAGGTVQIVTKDIPDQNFISVNVGLGYNTNTTFKDFKSGYRNLSDYFGFDDGSRKLPSNFPSLNRIQSGAVNREQGTSALSSLNPNFNVYNFTSLPNQSYQVSLGRVKDIGKNGNRLGAIFALTYRNSQQTITDAKIDFNAYQFTDSKYKFSTSVGGLANFAYSYGKNRITLKNIYNRTFDDQYLYRTGFNESTGNYNRFTAFDLTEKSLYKGTLQGDHGFGGNSKLTWVGSYSNITNTQPDQRKANYALKLNDPNGYSADIFSLGKQNARLFADLNENIYTAQIDYSTPVNFFKQKSTFKAGVLSQYRDREYSPRFLGPVLGTSTDPAALQISYLPLNRIFSRNTINQGFYTLADQTLPADPYTAKVYTNSGYAMLDNKFGEKARLVWGLRVEKFNLRLVDKDIFINDALLDDLNFLPSANFTYAVTPKANFRLSYSRTVARPELRELSEGSYYDYELLANVRGNHNLQSTQIHNVDVRYEFYPGSGQIMSVSGFYKNFKNAIERTNDDKLSTTDIVYFNTAEANTYGVEFELRKTLDFISGGLKNTTVYTNLALINSTVSDPNLNNLPGGSRPMVGQAPYVINAGLLQTAYNNKLTINALYNRVGPRIFSAQGTQYPSIYEASRDVLDVQLGLRVQKNKGEFKLNASDLLNQNTSFYYKDDISTYHLDTGGAIINRYKTGTSFTLSYSYTF